MKYDIPATFNIVTAWIDLSNNLQSSSLTLNELKEMSQSDLVEIAAHGHIHKNDDEDIKKSKDLLIEWLNLKEPIGFASPGSGMSKDYVLENQQKFKNMGFLYIRSGRNTVPPTERHIEAYENAKAQGCTGEALENTKQLSFGYDSMYVNSAIVFNYTSVSDLKQITQSAIRENACILLMLHGVNKKGEVAPRLFVVF